MVLVTSAAVEIVLQRERAICLGKNVAQADWIIAPTRFISEVTNVFWRYYLVLARRSNGYLMTMDISLKEVAKKNSIRLI